MRMWGYKDASKHTWTWRYEDAGMQAKGYEPKDTRIKGCENTSKWTQT